jgi:hypothetical protein
MNENAKREGSPPWHTYVTNRSQAALEEARRYSNQWIAWRADGTQIVAHHSDPLEVARMVEAAGLDSEDVILAYEPPEGEDTMSL